MFTETKLICLSLFEYHKSEFIQMHPYFNNKVISFQMIINYPYTFNKIKNKINYKANQLSMFSIIRKFRSKIT